MVEKGIAIVSSLQVHLFHIDFSLSADTYFIIGSGSYENDRRSSHGLPLWDPSSLSAWQSVYPPGAAISSTEAASTHGRRASIRLEILSGSLSSRFVCRLHLLRFKRR